MLKIQTKKPLLFLSFDVETDGPAPGLHSMLSMGWAGFTQTGEIVFEYEANLIPLPDAHPSDDTMKWWAKEENQNAWEYIHQNQREPEDVFTEFAAQISELNKIYNLKPIAWPVSYDWQYINYYFHRFIGSNPLGFSVMCIKTYLWAMSKNKSPSDKLDIGRYADPQFPHTHKALDDAKEQGAIFINAWTENTNV